LRGDKIWVDIHAFGADGSWKRHGFHRGADIARDRNARLQEEQSLSPIPDHDRWDEI
jgi:hypothetical protein